MPSYALKRAAGTRGSVVVDRCQVCGGTDLRPILFVGYLPPVNTMPRIGTPPSEEPSYPAQVLKCATCELVQLGLVVDPAILFPPEYPYTSGTTRILRENFAELAHEANSLLGLEKDDLVVDIGSNDGTLLGNFKEAGQRVLGIEPTDTGKLAIERGIPTEIAFFTPDVARRVRKEHGPARVVTAANVFAHIEDVHSVVAGILEMLPPDGVFISESHYWLGLVETLQYDTIYHEHLRYYSLTALRNLFAMHGLEIFHAKRIPTHGGSIRVYAARRGQRKATAAVAELLATEARELNDARLREFVRGVVSAKLGLYTLLDEVKGKGARVFGVGAPSRASTLINYVGLDDGIVDCVLEIKGSHKIGKYVPGTLIPVVDEQRLFDEQPDYALLFSWHIADELMPKLAQRGFKGRFIVPLPTARVVAGIA
ncbi:MAG TPA: class I SAM-dependent methyltransferase [Candidatus Limnocylindria bacterium]|nr:class I SAM-dependent methyltransferase [Candidatus Limnocylindria bacterium]